MSGPVFPPKFSGTIDPYDGFLCMSVHWRPNPEDPNPDMPGQKLSMSSFIPLRPRADCLCGSGKPFRDCCRPERYWRPVCPNPGLEGYSLVAPQSATFQSVEGTVLREQLRADTRLYCVDDDFPSSFWVFWGDPALEDQYGILCFGDFELKRNRTLVVSAMSDLRMRVLLELLSEIAGEDLGSPQLHRDSLQLIDKGPDPPPDRRLKRFLRRKR